MLKGRPQHGPSAVPGTGAPKGLYPFPFQWGRHPGCALGTIWSRGWNTNPRAPPHPGDFMHLGASEGQPERQGRGRPVQAPTDGATWAGGPPAGSGGSFPAAVSLWATPGGASGLLLEVLLDPGRAAGPTWTSQHAQQVLSPQSPCPAGSSNGGGGVRTPGTFSNCLHIFFSLVTTQEGVLLATRGKWSGMPLISHPRN